MSFDNFKTLAKYNKMLGKWTVVVFASRESLPIIMRTLRAAEVAAAGVADIDLIANGNSLLANDLQRACTRVKPEQEYANVRVWSIAQGDKANAWNQYLHCIWNGEEIAFFVDGYVRLNHDALKLLGHEIKGREDVLGGTGVPKIAREAARRPPSGYHGNFCCMKACAIELIRQRGIRLPIGLYRVDALMGALLSTAFDRARNGWDSSRILVHPLASWETDPKHWWRPSDVRAQVRRWLRQSRGVLENLAVRDFLTIRNQQPEEFPSTASTLILDWIERCPDQAASILRFNPLVRRALASIKSSPPLVPDPTPPAFLGYLKTD